MKLIVPRLDYNRLRYRLRPDTVLLLSSALLIGIEVNRRFGILRKFSIFFVLYNDRKISLFCGSMAFYNFIKKKRKNSNFLWIFHYLPVQTHVERFAQKILLDQYIQREKEKYGIIQNYAAYSIYTFIVYRKYSLFR